jgi:hypothetical protein
LWESFFGHCRGEEAEAVLEQYGAPVPGALFGTSTQEGHRSHLELRPRRVKGLDAFLNGLNYMAGGGGFVASHMQL